MTAEVYNSARAGLESTRGTPVTPTRILYFRPGGLTHNQDVGTILPDEAWNNRTPHRRAYSGLERDTLTMTGDCTYTDMIWLLNLAVDAEASGSVTDTSAYTWTFLPIHTSDALKSATLQYGWTDLLATVGWSLPGCVINRLAVTWTKAVGGEETGCSFEAEIMSAYTASQITAFTGSLSDRAVVNALGTSTATYVNGTGSAFGTTADTRINQVTWEVNNGFVYRDGFNGSNAAVEIVATGKRMSRVTAQRYFNDKTELDTYIAKTARRLQVKSTGAVIGATTAAYTLQLDQGGVWEVHNKAESDGLIYANLEMAPLYDSALSSDMKWTIINVTDAIT